VIIKDSVNPACFLCGSAEVEPAVATERGWGYHRCGRCEVLFLAPRPTPEELERIYQGHSGATFHRGADRTMRFERELEARLRWALVSRRLRPGARIVELGCGTGDFLALARARGHPVLGFEADDDPIRFAREAFGLDVRRGALEGKPEPADAMVWFNVLSHLADPAETLRTARRWLRPGGLLVIETGNVGELPARRFPPLGAPEHLFHFGERGLRRLLDRCGYEVIGLERRNVEWQRRLLGVRPPRSNAAAAVPAAPRPSPWRRPASWLLLTARFRLGRFGADKRHFCTLFIFARAG
jgi:SAM-dependent methyltransferase